MLTFYGNVPAKVDTGICNKGMCNVPAKTGTEVIYKQVVQCSSVCLEKRKRRCYYTVSVKIFIYLSN